MEEKNESIFTRVALENADPLSSLWWPSIGSFTLNDTTDESDDTRKNEMETNSQEKTKQNLNNPEKEETLKEKKNQIDEDQEEDKENRKEDEERENENVDNLIVNQCINGRDENSSANFLRPSVQGNVKGKKGRKEKICICSQLPKVTIDDIVKANQLMALLTTIHAAQNKYNQDMDGTNSTSQISVDTSTDIIELTKGSGIIVDNQKLQYIQQLYQKNPREMVRRLMRLILGEKILKESSPTGKNGWKPIPEKIYTEVKNFINNNASEQRYKIDNKEYREVLTSMCATLRNPREKKVIKRKYDCNVEKSEN